MASIALEISAWQLLAPVSEPGNLFRQRCQQSCVPASGGVERDTVPHRKQQQHSADSGAPEA